MNGDGMYVLGTPLTLEAIEDIVADLPVAEPAPGNLWLDNGVLTYVSVLDADAVTLIAAMDTAPDATRQTLISDTIAALKTAGVWAKLDELWFMAAHNEQAGLLGWKRLKNLNKVNAPTFTTDRGIAGNGTTSYLNTNFTPSTDGVNYTRNDACFGLYSGTDSNADTRSGVRGTHVLELIPRLSGLFYGQVNASSTGYMNASVADSLGLFAVQRAAANIQRLLKNGEDIGGNTATGTGLPEISIFIGATNVAGTPNALDTRQFRFGFFGASLTEAEHLALFTHVEAYMDAIGAGVVA